MSSITPTEVGSFFLSLVVPITIGVVAAGFTAFFALNRFYREKWWEKKHSAYNQLIDKLLELKDLYGHASDFYEMQQEADRGGWPPPKGSVDWNYINQIKAQINRLYVLSPISFSNNVSTLLNGFFEKNAELAMSVHEEGYPDFVAYNEIEIYLQGLIDTIVSDAKDELKFN